MKKKLVILAAGVASAFVLTACGKTKIDLDQYVDVQYEGYNTIGTATVSFDYKHFVRDYEEDLKLTKEGEDERKEMKQAAEELGLDRSAADFLATYLQGELDKSEGLSNGDTITFKWDLDESEIQERFKCEISFSEELTLEVKGLEEAQVFDPFEGYNLSFVGTAPDGRISVEQNPPAGNPRLNYEFSKNEGLSNGDVVTVSVSAYGDDVVKYCVENYGMIPSATSKDFTVEGLPAYVQSSSELTEDTLAKMQKQTEDVITSYVASEWADEASLAGMTYIGNYFIRPKTGVSSSAKNQVVIVYKIDCLLECGEGKDTFKGIVSGYYPLTFENVVNLADGTQSLDLSDYDKTYEYWSYDTGVDDGWWGTLTYRFYGYDNLDNMFNDFITKNVEKYEYENNVADVETNYDDVLGGEADGEGSEEGAEPAAE